MFFLRLRGLQHGPSMAHIKNTAKVSGDINNSVAFYLSGIRTLEESSRHNANYSLICSDAFTHSTTESAVSKYCYKYSHNL